MKKLLLIFFVFFLFGCKDNKKSEIIKENKLTINKIEVVVEGEVLKPGKYLITEYMTYQELFTICGLKESSDITNYDLEKYVSDLKISIPKTYFDSDLININTASLEELMKLPGIKESLANNILEYRKNNGYFMKIDDIMKVNGIKEKKFETLKDLISV